MVAGIDIPLRVPVLLRTFIVQFCALLCCSANTNRTHTPTRTVAASCFDDFFRRGQSHLLNFNIVVEYAHTANQAQILSQQFPHLRNSELQHIRSFVRFGDPYCCALLPVVKSATSGRDRDGEPSRLCLCHIPTSIVVSVGQKLVSYMQATRFWSVRQSLQSLDPDRLVPNVHKTVVSPVEGTKWNFHLEDSAHNHEENMLAAWLPDNEPTHTLCLLRTDDTVNAVSSRAYSVSAVPTATQHMRVMFRFQWKKLRRLPLLASTDLASQLVPLFRGDDTYSTFFADQSCFNAKRRHTLFDCPLRKIQHFLDVFLGVAGKFWSSVCIQQTCG